MAISLLASESGANKRTGISAIAQRGNRTLAIPENNYRETDQDNENNGGFLGGVAYLGEKVALNALSGIEGIWDYTAGGVAKLFGADSWAERQFANDWVNYNHADEWFDPDEGWSFAGDIAGGIGSSLPAIAGVAAGSAIAVASGGSLAPVAAGIISGSIAGLGAAGNATKEAYRETGKLGGKEFGYGALTGVTEGSLEAITAGIGTGTGRIVSSIAKKSAGEVTQTLVKSGVKNVLKTLGQDFVSEAFEEGVAEILSPVYQRMTYNPDAKNASAQEVAYAALIGGLSGSLMSGANVTVNTSQNLISGNKVVSEGKAATVLENARQITEWETAHETGYESFKAVSNTYQQLSESLKSTNGEVTTVKQKMLLGQLTRENAVATFSPFIERSAENIVRNVDTVVERYNALGMKDANGNPITFTREQILSGIDLGADRKTYVKQMRKALSSNSTLATLAVADAVGNITMDTRRFSELALEGKNLANLADYENFRQNATAEEKAAVGAALGIENFDLVKVEDFRSAVEQFAADGKTSVWAEQSRRVRMAVETAADTAKTMPHILRKNMTDGVYRYTSEDSTVNMAVFKEGSEYHIYDYDSGKISRSLTSQEVNKVLRDVRQGTVSQTSEIIEGTQKQYAVSESNIVPTENGMAVEINLDSEIQIELSNATPEGRGEIVERVLKEAMLDEGSYEFHDGTKAIMDNKDIAKVGHSKNEIKNRSSVSMKDLVKVARLYAEDWNIAHNKFRGFKYYKARVIIEGEIYECSLNVGYGKFDKQYHIYDVNQFDNAKRSDSPILSNPRKSADQTVSRTITSKDSITDSAENVNKNVKKTSGISENFDVSDLDDYARENVKDYNKLSAPNQAEIRAMIREGRALGVSESDVLVYAKISARTGVRVTFDQGKTLIGRRKGSKELVYADGFYDPATNEICVNPNGKRSADKLLIHELAHAIYGGEKGMRLAKRNVKNLSAEEKKAISDRYAEIDHTDEIELLDEYNAHYAEGILGNADTLERLLDDAPTVKDRILDFLRGAKGDTDAQRSAAARRLFFKYKRLFDRFAQQNAQNIAAEKMPNVATDTEKKTPHGEAPEANGVTSINDEKMHDSGKRYAIERISETVDKALANKGDIGEKFNQKKISEIPQNIVAVVSTASEGKIDLSKKFVSVNGSDIWHEYRRHNDMRTEIDRDQIAFTPETIKDAVAAIYDPDIVESVFADVNNPTQRQSFAYAKKSPDGHYVVVEAVGGKRNPNVVPVMIIQVSERKWDRWITKGKTLGDMLYENDQEKLAALNIAFNKKNRVTVAQFASNEAIANTPRSPQFNNSIPDSEEKVNRNPENSSKRRLALPQNTDTAKVTAEFTEELKAKLADESEREYDADIERAKAKDIKGAYHSSLQKRNVPHTDKERAEYWKSKAKDNETRSKVLGNISVLAQKMKDLKLGTYHNATQDQSKQFAGSVEGLSKIVWNGNLSVKLARKHIGTLRVWYKQDNPILCYENRENPGYYNAEIAEMLAGIADGEGTLSVADLRTIRDIMQYFIKLDETYNKVFKNGKWVDAKPEAKRYIGTINANKDLKVGFLAQRGCQIYMETFSEPLTVARRMDYYAKDGFYTETLLSLREAAVNADVTEMEIKADYDDFMQRNKKYLAKATEETVPYRGTEIPRMHLIGLYMTFKRKQAQAGLVINGFSFRDKNGETVRVPGTHPEFGQKKDLTQKDITVAAEAEIVSIAKLLTDTDKEYIGILEKAFNEDARQLKADTDIQRLGYTNARLDYYYPIRRGDIAKNIDASTFFDEMDRVSNASYNKDTVRGARQKLFIESADSVFNRHVHSVCLYASLSPVIDTYNRLYNLDVSGNPGDPNSVKTAGENVWKNGSRYIAKLVADIQGVPASSSEGQKLLGFIRSGYAQYQLGANPKTWASQISSIFASSSLLDADAITRGMGISSKEVKGVDKYCPLAKLRNNDNTVAKTQGLLERVNKVSEVLMEPIGKVDRFVICRLFGACQAQVEKNGGAKVGTEENKIAAGKLLREVILETQQNSAATEKSAAMRSGSEILRTVTMFSADSMKVLGRVIDSVGEVSVLKVKLKQKGLDAKTRTALESDLKAAHRKARKSVGALMLSALYMVGIARLFRWLYAKEDDEESTAASLVTDFVGNLFGGLPVLRDVVSFFTEGYEVDNYAYSALNDLLSSSKSLFDAFGDIVSGDASSQDIAAGTKRMLYAVGQLFGIPARNVYNVTYGLTKRFSPETAYKIDMVFYKKNYQNDLKKAIENGDEDMVNLIMGLLYGERISEAVPEAVHGELYALSLAGHKVIPRSIPSTITYNDEERALTDEEREAIKEVYSASLSSLEKLFTKPTYGKLTEEQKVEAINYVYDTYYKTALKDTLGVDRLSNVQRAADVIGAETLALLHVATKDLESDVDRDGNAISESKRKKVLAAINSLELSAEKKLLLICMKGYSIKDGDIRGMSAERAKRYLLRYILSMGGKTQAEKAELAELCGFTVKNGKIVIKTAS